MSDVDVRQCGQINNRNIPHYILSKLLTPYQPQITIYLSSRSQEKFKTTGRKYCKGNICSDQQDIPEIQSIHSEGVQPHEKWYIYSEVEQAILEAESNKCQQY
jgi:hypothetical protein